MAAAETVRAASDLPVRAASAVVMVIVAGAAFWLGGRVADALIVAVVLGVMAEWTGLVLAFANGMMARAVWLLAGLAYLGFAAYSAVLLRHDGSLPLIIATVVAIDVGAYFAGRTFGGPKLAPAISPSKTWSGLAGAIVGSCAVQVLAGGYAFAGVAGVVIIGAGLAIVAQAGDFFESWMKRRAGVKDSGRLIPGHGGLFDRTDGLIAVLFVVGIAVLFAAMDM